MKKSIGKARRLHLNQFLSGPRTGSVASRHYWNGLLPYSPRHPHNHRYWESKYWYMLYGEERALSYGYKAAPLTDDDIKYIESLVNIDPFISADENKEFLVE